MTTHDVQWFAEQIGKGPDWVRRHLADIPHRKIGQSVRFTDADLAAYLDQTAVRPMRMATTGRRRSA